MEGEHTDEVAHDYETEEAAELEEAEQDHLTGSVLGKRKQRAPFYKWGHDAEGKPSDDRLLKLVNKYTEDRYGVGPYNANTVELATKKRQ